jgi:hypothetical protein
MHQNQFLGGDNLGQCPRSLASPSMDSNAQPRFEELIIIYTLCGGTVTVVSLVRLVHVHKWSLSIFIPSFSLTF